MAGERPPIGSGDGPEDPLVTRLRELERSINVVKRRRGEEDVTIVDAPSHLTEQQHNQAEQVVRDQQLDPAATAATVGVLLAQGNEGQAVKLLELAVDAGDAMAATTLGLILEQRRDIDRAFEMQQLAADKGDDMGLYNLGRMRWQHRDDRTGALDVLRRSNDPRADQLIGEIEGR
jgi:hypothetical protein